MNWKQNNFAIKEYKLKNRIWEKYFKYKSSIISLWSFIIISLIAIFADFIAPYDRDFISSNISLVPSWYPNGKIELFLGTDYLGRDILSYTIYSVQFIFLNSALIIFIAIIVGGIIGSIIGMVYKSHYKFARIIYLIFNLTSTIPHIILILLIISVQQTITDEKVIIISMICLTIPQFTITFFDSIKKYLNKEYIIALKLDGATNYQIFTIAILPNILSNIVMSINKHFSLTILNFVAFIFIKLETNNTLPTIEKLLTNSYNYSIHNPWEIIVLCIAITTLIIIVNAFTYRIYKAVN